MALKKRFKKIIVYLNIILVTFGSFGLTGNNYIKAEENNTKTIVIDGEDVDEYNRFKGFGTVTGNNSGRLLVDYKEEHPDKYWEIMNQLFNPDTGAGLTHVKVELGGDVNSSSGTEPATMRYADEPANVLRGAGFQFAADAKSINENITIEILRWGEPRWTWTGIADGDYEARYQWYKKTVDAIYEEYGFKLDYIGISQNERAISNNGKIETDWIKYFIEKIKAEPNYEEDYKDIKFVAADGYRDNSSISRVLLNDPDLRDEIDVISDHYTTSASSELKELQETLISEGKDPKEVWISEGIAPMVNAQERLNMEPEYGGLGGQAGIVDVISRIIHAYTWEGADFPLNAVSFDFQPSVAAFYEGARYTPKQLLSAYDPWSGFYQVDGGIVGVRHIMNFVGQNDLSTDQDERWQYIEGATYSDGGWFDGGVDVDTSNHNYLTLKDPETDDYTTLFANNTKQTRRYRIEAQNLSGKENATVYLWETRGPDAGQAHDANWFQNIAKIEPNDGVYEIEVQPYSLLTISTLDKESEVDNFAYESEPVDFSEDTIMPLPYTDDFEYDEYGLDEQGRDYVERRGGTPRYTTDQYGAFEVVKAPIDNDPGSFYGSELDYPEAEERGNLLQQVITPDIIGAEWAVWGGNDGSESGSNPYTLLGDHRWINYKASYDFLLDNHTSEVEGRDNYALIGLRQSVHDLPADTAAPYNARIFADGTYQILKFTDVLIDGEIEDFDNEVWHNMAFEAKNNILTLYLDGESIATYEDKNYTAMTGRIVIGSGYYGTLYDNLRVDPIEGYPYKSEKIDNARGRVFETEEEALNNNDKWNPIGYVGDWEYNQSGYVHFNRTQMTTKSDYPVWNGRLITHQDTTSERGTLHKVYYSDGWNSNSGNAWGNADDNAFMEITFKGNEFRLYGETNPGNGKGDIYLNDELVGEANYLNNSSVVQEVFSMDGLEEAEHTLRVEAKNAFISFTDLEVETEDELGFASEYYLSPTQITHISTDEELGDEENTVYAYREGESIWGSVSSNAWANFDDNPYIFINFTGTGIDYHAGSDEKTTYQFELDGEIVGNYDTNEDGIRYSVRDLDEGRHTLKVSLGDNERLDEFMDYRGVTIYSTPQQSDNKFIFDFEGTGFNLFGATQDALIDVQIDDELVAENHRVFSTGNRQTSYNISGLEYDEYTAIITIKGGTFTLDGIDIIKEAEKIEEVNKDLLAEEIAKVKELDADQYTEASWSELASALTSAEAVLANAEATQEEVDIALATLKTAISELEKREDPEGVEKQELEEKVAEAKAIDGEDYTETTFTALQEAIEIAQEVLADEDATQEEVDEALSALETAISGLEKITEDPEGVEKQELEEKVAEAKAIDGENYTETTFTALQEAIELAQEVLADEDATQEEVDEALSALETAISGLEKIAEDPEGVEKQELEEKVAEAKAIDGEDYTETTFTALQEAIKVAQEVLADEDATQEEVDEALKMLNDAISGLQGKSKESQEGNNQEEAGRLPSTATSMYAMLLLGFLLLSFGTIVVYIKRNRQGKNNN